MERLKKKSEYMDCPPGPIKVAVVDRWPLVEFSTCHIFRKVNNIPVYEVN